MTDQKLSSIVKIELARLFNRTVIKLDGKLVNHKGNPLEAIKKLGITLKCRKCECDNFTFKFFRSVSAFVCNSCTDTTDSLSGKKK